MPRSDETRLESRYRRAPSAPNAGTTSGDLRERIQLQPVTVHADRHVVPRRTRVPRQRTLPDLDLLDVLAVRVREAARHPALDGCPVDVRDEDVELGRRT